MPIELRPSPGLLRVVVALGLVHLLLTLVVVAIRLSSTVRHGAFVETTGFEGVGLNVIAYTEHHWPPYRDLGVHVTTAIFNVGFYAVYAGAARMAERLGASPLLSLRLLTFFVVLVAAIGFGAWVHGRLPSSLDTRLRWTLAWPVAIGILMGPFVGWWTLTARPDGFVMILEAAGLVAAVGEARGHWRHGATVAACVFSCAVSFKQTEIATFALLILAWFIAGRWRAVAIGVAALAGTLIADVWLGGPHYIDNVVRVAAAANYSIAFGLRQVVYATVTGFPVFVPAAIVAVLVVRHDVAAGGWRTLRRQPVLPALVVFVGSGAIALVALTRVGADRNYLFPSLIAGFVLIVHYLSDPSAWTSSTLRVTAGSFLGGTCLLSAYLVLPGSFGRITFDEIDRASTRRVAMQRAAAPVLIEYGLDAVPWHSGHADSESVDWIVYDSGVRLGIIGRSIESRIAARHYAVAFSQGRFRNQLLDAGYRRVTAFTDGTEQYER